MVSGAQSADAYLARFFMSKREGQKRKQQPLAMCGSLVTLYRGVYWTPRSKSP